MLRAGEVACAGGLTDQTDRPSVARLGPASRRIHRPPPTWKQGKVRWAAAAGESDRPTSRPVPPRPAPAPWVRFRSGRGGAEAGEGEEEELLGLTVRGSRPAAVARGGSHELETRRRGWRPLQEVGLPALRRELLPRSALHQQVINHPHPRQRLLHLQASNSGIAGSSIRDSFLLSSELLVFFSSELLI